MNPDKARCLELLSRQLKKEGCGPLHIARCLAYESRVFDLQAEGLDRGDAQGIADLENISPLNANPYE